MSKHTPGPWQKSGWVSDWSQPHREDSKTSTVRTVVDADGEAVAIAVVCYDGWTDKEKDAELEANARLISSAPELLAALILMVRTHDEPAETLLQETKEQRWLAQARAAIKKATQ